MEPQNNDAAEDRYFTNAERRTLQRFLFANAGGLLAVVGMIFSGGMFLAEIRNISSTTHAIQQQQAIVGVKITDIERTVAVLQTQISYIDGRERRAEQREPNQRQR